MPPRDVNILMTRLTEELARKLDKLSTEQLNLILLCIFSHLQLRNHQF